jgi:hypothetical protein
MGATQFGVYSKNAGGESELEAKVAIVNVKPSNGVESLIVVQSASNTATLKFTDQDAVDQNRILQDVYYHRLCHIFQRCQYCI